METEIWKVYYHFLEFRIQNFNYFSDFKINLIEKIKDLITLGDSHMLYGGFGGQEKSCHAQQLKPI